MSKSLYFVGPWDLNRGLPCVPSDPSDGPVLLVESRAKGRAMPWHRKKLVLVLSAMRHFAQELRDAGYDVTILNAASYAEGVRAHAKERGLKRIVAMMPREHGMSQELAALSDEFEMHFEDDGGPGRPFLLPRADFEQWAGEQKAPKNSHQRWRMDRFYRAQRKRTEWLMEDERPAGGKWSLDAENRKVPKGETPPPAAAFEPDEITLEVMEQVESWPNLWGSTEGFSWPVTREQALQALRNFIRERAADFGPYQDAMKTGEPFLWHALISPAMNLSLLTADEVCEAMLEAYESGEVPLQSAEGFIRQILGWREFIRGIYWQRVLDMRAANSLGAKRALPQLYWEPETTEMACLRACVSEVKEHGYAHHIQRLMVLGNFALLIGVEPIQLSHWFWAAFVDAYEWVELPNVHGMALYADDTFTTKPYAASASYINKMSDYCKDCRYNPKERVGEDACPFGSLFWNFMASHRERLDTNPRIGMLYRSWDRWTEQERDAIQAHANAFLDSLPSSPDYGFVFEDDQC